MNKEDARTKQDLLFEVSSLGSQLSDEIIKNEKLQQENKQLKEINEEHRKLNGELREENKRLTELCDRYEEEHSTTFTEWNIGLREQVELQQRIDKAIEYIENHKGKTCHSIMEDWKEEYVLLHKNSVELLEILKGE